jgi:YVTN family beta-propeller protein
MDARCLLPWAPSNRVAVIDTNTYSLKDYILVGQRPWHLELDPDGTKLYVANGLTMPSDRYRWGAFHGGGSDGRDRSSVSCHRAESRRRPAAWR